MENSKIKTIDVFVNEIELSEEQETFELTPEQEQMNQEFMKRLEQMCIDSITGCTCKAQAEFMQRKTQEAITLSDRSARCRTPQPSAPNQGMPLRYP